MTPTYEIAVALADLVLADLTARGVDWETPDEHERRAVLRRALHAFIAAYTKEQPAP